MRTLKRFPSDIWIRIKTGDVYEALDMDEEALDQYVGAMKTAKAGYDWEGAAERLPAVLKKLGREDEQARIARRYPRPSDRERQKAKLTDASAWDDGPSVDLDDGQLAPVAKLGRNDLCPCGSGKKYKKCCLPQH